MRVNWLSSIDPFRWEGGGEAVGRALIECGRGRVFDNIFIERLWRSVKYEEVYLKEYESMLVAVRSLAEYFESYNHDRPHQAFAYATPAEVYFGREEAGRKAS